MGLLTKIFGNGEGRSEGSNERPGADVDAEGSGIRETDGRERTQLLPPEARSSGLRASLDAATAAAQEQLRQSPRRPEHPRLFLKATPVRLDPLVPGSTRRPQISLRPSGVETVPYSASDVVPSAALERPDTRTVTLARPTSDSGAVSDAAALRAANGLRSKTALVVSPVSLTAEQLRVPQGARRPLPTLLGLGAALEGYDRSLESVAAAGRADAAVREFGVPPPLPPDSAWADDGEHEVDPEIDGVPTPRVVTLEQGDLTPLAGEVALKSLLASAAPEVRGASEARVPSREELDAAVELLSEFAIQLSIGPLSDEWIPEVRGAMSTLQSAPAPSDGSRGAALFAGMESLIGSGSLAGRALRVPALQVLTELSVALPDWSAAGRGLATLARKRERAVLHELFLVLDGLKAHQRNRLEQEMSLAELGSSSAEALAAALEAPIERARELSEVVAAYLVERQLRAPDLGRRGPGGHVNVWHALGDLEQRCREFNDCNEDQSSALRAARQRRRDAVTRINLILSEQGELELLEALVPCSVAERVRRLRERFGAGAEEQG